MTLKMKLASTICAFMLILGLTIMGVFAAPSATINLGGSLTFTATDVNATVTGSVDGTASAVELPQLNFTNTTDPAVEGARWSGKELAFDSKGSTITIVITVTNNAKDRPLYVQVQDAVPENASVVDKTMKTLATVDASTGTDYDGSTLTLDANGTGTYQAFFEITLKVKDANTSLDGATYGYNIYLKNEKPAEILATTEYEKLSFSEADEENKTISVSMVDAETTTGDLEIPAQVKYNDEVYTVNAIPMQAFMECSLGNVKLPNTIETINMFAFYACEIDYMNIPSSVTSALGILPLSTVDTLIIETDYTEDMCNTSSFGAASTISNIIFEEGVTVIGKSAFYCIYGTKTISLPSTLEVIGDSAFSCYSGKVSCDSDLTNLTIPKNVTSIGEEVFEHHNKLVEIYNQSTVEITKESLGLSSNSDLRIYSSGESKVTHTEEGLVFYEYEGEYLLVSYHGEETDLVLPDTFNGKSYSIRQEAFVNSSYLTSIVIGNNVTSIGFAAFGGCCGLTGKLIIPNSVTNIDNSAFSGCASLTEIVLPLNLTNIESHCFLGCSGLNTIIIPSSITNIGVQSFDGCDALKTVNYRGTQEQWNKIIIDSYNTVLDNATKVYNYVG